MTNSVIIKKHSNQYYLFIHSRDDHLPDLPAGKYE
jgi:hypothetical protein